MWFRPCPFSPPYPSGEFGLIRSCFFHGLDSYEEMVHSISTRKIMVWSPMELSRPEEPKQQWGNHHSHLASFPPTRIPVPRVYTLNTQQTHPMFTTFPLSSHHWPYAWILFLPPCPQLPLSIFIKPIHSHAPHLPSRPFILASHTHILMLIPVSHSHITILQIPTYPFQTPCSPSPTTTKNVIYDAFFLDAYIKCHYLFSKMGINDACIILAL